jgi:flagellar hook-basal body complex protein FliE
MMMSLLPFSSVPGGSGAEMMDVVAAARERLAGSVSQSQQGTETSSGTQAAVEGFGELLQTSLSQLNAIQERSNKMAEGYAVGDPNVTLHDVMSAGSKAELSLELALQIRNKIVTAYQDVMRMPI